MSPAPTAEQSLTPLYDAMCEAVRDFHAHQDEFYEYLGTLPATEQLVILAPLCDSQRFDLAAIRIRNRAEKLAKRLMREAALDSMVLNYCRQRGLKLTPESELEGRS